MLTIILNILSILGILLLAILAILLLIILTVLFVPIFYRIKADKNADLHVCIKANWLLGLIRVLFMYPEPGNVTVKVLFFKIFDSGAEPEDKPEKSKPTRRKQKKEAPRTDKSKDASDNRMASSDKKMEDKAQASAQHSETRQAGTQQSATHQAEAGEHEKQRQGGEQQSNAEGQSPIEKLQYTIRDICDKIKNIRDNTNHYKEILLCEDTKGLLNHSFIRLGKILKSIRPRKLKADIRFGTGSPDTTGYVYAAYGILCPYLGRKVLVVPDFDQAVLEGELDAAGHITVFKLLWHGLMLVFDKRLKKLIAKLKQED